MVMVMLIVMSMLAEELPELQVTLLFDQAPETSLQAPGVPLTHANESQLSLLAPT